MKHLEVLSFEHKGITIRVRIDYEKNKISLLENDNMPKRWLFADRGVEFMQGWLNILDAMKYAIGEAKKLYEADLAENRKLWVKPLKEMGDNWFVSVDKKKNKKK